MIRILRLVGSVLSGFIAFGILASVTFLLKLKLDERIRFIRGEEDSYLILFLAIVPFSLIAGSFMTGYLAQPYVRRTIINYLLLSPGSYLAFLLLIWPLGDSGFIGIVLVALLIWTLSSVFGMYLGSRNRAKKASSPPST